jgi:predicted component of type VI protein secretion system
MRLRAWLPLLLCLAACSSTPKDSSKLTLRNTAWDHVNVQLVITKGGNCDATGSDVVSSQDFVLHRDQTKTFTAPNGTSVCWRHDRYPANPTPGQWSGWSHAILYPGGDDTTTDL